VGHLTHVQALFCYTLWNIDAPKSPSAVKQLDLSPMSNVRITERRVVTEGFSKNAPQERIIARAATRQRIVLYTTRLDEDDPIWSNSQNLKIPPNYRLETPVNKAPRWVNQGESCRFGLK